MLLVLNIEGIKVHFLSIHQITLKDDKRIWKCSCKEDKCKIFLKNCLLCDTLFANFKTMQTFPYLSDLGCCTILQSTAQAVFHCKFATSKHSESTPIILCMVLFFIKFQEVPFENYLFKSRKMFKKRRNLICKLIVPSGEKNGRYFFQFNFTYDDRIPKVKLSRGFSNSML